MKKLKNKKFIAISLSFFAIAFFLIKLYPAENLPTHTTLVVKKTAQKKVISADAEQFLATYDKALTDLMAEAHTPGAAIVIVKDSTIIYLKGLGVKENGKPDKIDVNTVFRIASVSKCFAAMLTGILVEDKVLGWDDKVVSYLPEFCLKSPEQTTELSIRHVLSHTTGLPYHTFTNMVEEGIDINTLLYKLREVDLASKVGESYSYQNVAYSLIGEVMKSATGTSYEELMMEKVFQPLHMQTASISYDAIMHNHNIAKPHRMQRRNWIPAKITNTYYNVAPAGGINASISDMGRWLMALLGDKPNVVTNHTLDEMFMPYIKARSKNRNYGKKNRLKDSYYAMGWRILHYPNDTLIYHGGFVNGYRSEVAINRKEKIGICILANAPGRLADNGIPMFFNMYFEKRGDIKKWFDESNELKHNTFATIK
jgi:beta-lactamase class C